MSDDELTKLAAEAFGIDEYESQFWGFDPLNEDADAFRLAVKLKISVKFNSNFVGTLHEDIIGCAEFYFTDPYAATRRAIVRAAAEIGRGME
jgi:hypothetical protein